MRDANTITVQCDAPGCDWNQSHDVDKAAEWHNAPCPKCGHAPVLSDDDMELLRAFVALRDAGLATVGENATPPEGPHVYVHFETRGLRKK